MAYEMLIRGEHVVAETLAAISAAYCERRDEAFEGASTFPSDVKVRQVGYRLPFARISYNGRIWRDTSWQPGDEPIYDNRT